MKNNDRHFLYSLVLTSALISFASPSFSVEFQSHNSIKTIAEAFLISQLESSRLASMEIKVTTGRLDPRLKLPQCQLALEPFLPMGANLSGNTSIGVHCQDSKPWSLFITAKIIKYADVYVTSRYLPRGTALDVGDFTVQKRNISTQSTGYITDIANVSGKVLRRPLRHNSIIPPNALSKALLIKRGDRVTILAQNLGFKIRMKGKALKNGAKGEVIRIQNLKSKRIIEGKVLSAGVVGVRL